MYIEKKLFVFSILIGLGITLLSSVLINNVVIGEFPDIRFVSIPMLGVSYWGYPLPWMKQVVYPGAVKEPIWSHLVIDVVYWSMFVYIVKGLYTAIKSSMKKPEDLKLVNLPLPKRRVVRSRPLRTAKRKTKSTSKKRAARRRR